MAQLFVKQAKQYSEGRPSYPQELFHFIASKTPSHDLAWDVGTGSGQAAKSLAAIYKSMVATDTSQQQLEYAAKLPNVRYERTPPKMSTAELEALVGKESTFDLVTVAQAMHWFDLPAFYEQAKRLLKKPDGVIAAWCYTLAQVNEAVDALLHNLYFVDLDPYWESPKKLVDDEYRSIEFPFEAVEGCAGTGPFEFTAERVMDLDGYLTWLRSWSAYQTAKVKGVEVLGEDIVERFRDAWNGDGGGQKRVTFPVFLRIGKVGNDS
nr:putative methyltransferase DDB_G0268948 [Ipomoea batatas]